jgi:hypothetical protein
MCSLGCKAVVHYVPKWFGVTGVAILVIVGVVTLVLKAQVPDEAREAAAASVGEFIGRVVLSLILAVFGGFFGGVAWEIFARNFALVEGIGGQDGAGIAAMTTAAITAVVAFVTYNRWSRPSR